MLKALIVVPRLQTLLHNLMGTIRKRRWGDDQFKLKIKRENKWVKNIF